MTPLLNIRSDDRLAREGQQSHGWMQAGALERRKVPAKQHNGRVQQRDPPLIDPGTQFHESARCNVEQFQRGTVQKRSEGVGFR